MEIESSVNPPKVSITNGMNSTPINLQAERWEVNCYCPMEGECHPLASSSANPPPLNRQSRLIVFFCLFWFCLFSVFNCVHIFVYCVFFCLLQFCIVSNSVLCLRFEIRVQHFSELIVYCNEYI